MTEAKKLRFHWLLPGRIAVAWKFASDGKWSFNGVVKRLEFHRFQGTGIRGVNLTILSLSVWLGWSVHEDIRP